MRTVQYKEMIRLIVKKIILGFAAVGLTKSGIEFIMLNNRYSVDRYVDVFFVRRLGKNRFAIVGRKA